ncbi:MAG: hypothetical protein ABIJ97_02845 [Bacteroidota bacterium]
MNTSFYYNFLLICIFVYSCNPKFEKDYNTLSEKSIFLNQIINDSLNSYTYFVPSYYDTNKVWPVIFFFDPQAKGEIPLKKYKKLGENYGYILIGSNKSRNGMNEQEQLAVFRNIKLSVKNMFSIHVSRIYTAGFSGGARVSSGIAINEGGINGVIACGAGFPQVNKPIKNQFHFISLVGIKDFNYPELVLLHKNLDNIKMRNEFISFEGNHEWPGEEIMEKAFLWLEINAMRDNIKSKDDSIIDLIEKDFNIQIEKARSSFEKFTIAIKAVSYLNGIKDITCFNSIIDSLQNSEIVQETLASEINNMNNEIIEHQSYMENLSLKDFYWWKKEITRLKNIELKSRDYESLKTCRTLNYISLLMFMNANSAINQNNTVQAKEVLELYEIADPENPDVYYLYSLYFATLKDTLSAEKYLNIAITKGFDDSVRLFSEKKMNILGSTDTYKSFINNKNNDILLK